MSKSNVVNLETIEDKKEKEILELLDQKGECQYGEILKELEISVHKGQGIIYSFLDKGILSYKRPSYLQLNVELK